MCKYSCVYVFTHVMHRSHAIAACQDCHRHALVHTDVHHAHTQMRIRTYIHTYMLHSPRARLACPAYPSPLARCRTQPSTSQQPCPNSGGAPPCFAIACIVTEPN
jgi:hypothetical protein